MRTTNPAGVALIKEFEGFVPKSYLCPAGVLTIGYGSTGTHVKRGMTVTREEGEALLRYDLLRFERGVEVLTQGVPTTDNQFAAMVSLAFNIGLAAFTKSTVLKQHRKGNRQRAAAAFLLWIKGGGRKLPGLVRRRNAERKLYLTP